MARQIHGTYPIADVNSHTREGVKYTLTLTGELKCSCPDSVYRDRDCKHVREFARTIIRRNEAGMREHIVGLRREADRLESLLYL